MLGCLPELNWLTSTAACTYQQLVEREIFLFYKKMECFLQEISRTGGQNTSKG